MMNRGGLMKCNICGKDFSDFDLLNSFKISQDVEYGSTHDGEYLDLHICNKCLDDIAHKCLINPFKQQL